MKDFFSEVLLYLRHTKKYWLIPFLIMIGFFAVVALVFIGTNPTLAPFIYTIF